MDTPNTPLLPPQENHKQHFCHAPIFLMKQSTKDVRSNLCHYFVSVLACFLAMLLALVANTVIGSSSAAYLKMAEMKQGEIDVLLSPSQAFSQHGRFLNSTRIDELLQNSEISMTPRLEFEYTSIMQHKEESQGINLRLMLINSERERDLGIGRRWTESELKEGECAIHEAIARELDLKINSTAFLHIRSSEYFGLLRTIYGSAKNEDSEVQIPCKVAIIFNNLGGKVQVGKDSENVLMELTPFLKHVGKNWNTTNEGFKNFLINFRAADISNKVLTNHPNRMDIYRNHNYEDAKQIMIRFTSNILGNLGFYPADTHLNILENFLKLRLGAVFLKIVLNLVVVILSLLSSYLIYTMLMMYAETKAFDIGILRTVGLNKFRIVLLVLSHSFFFAIPAFLLALVASFPTLVVLTHYLEGRLDFPVKVMPTGAGILWASGVGLFIPLFASIFPIRYVLSQEITKAITVTYNKNQGVYIEYSAGGSESPAARLVPFGFTIIIFGLCIHYFVPLALLSMDYQLLSWVMLLVLIGMIMGLVLLSTNVEHLLEKTLINLLLFYESAATQLVVKKNLVAHRIRNSRVGLIQTLSLGFILFILVAYNMELRNSELTLLASHVSDLEVMPRKANFGFSEVIELEQILLNNAEGVSDFCWVPKDLQSASHLSVENNYISDQGRLKKFSISTQGISPNYFDVANSIFLQPYEQNKTTDLSLGEQLYTPRGSQGLGTGSFVKRSLDSTTSTTTPGFLFVLERPNADLLYSLKPIYLLDFAPGFHMHRRPRSSQSVFMSLPLYLKYANSTSLSTVPMKYLSVKTKGTTSKKVKDELVRFSFRHDGNFTVWSYDDEKEDIGNLKGFLDIIFLVVVGLFLVLSFFSLSTASTANILEQAKELAVLRSIGFTKFKAVLICTYEEVVFVLSNAIIGTAIGFAIGYTLALQRALFTELPVTFVFPTTQLIVIFVASVVCAVVCAVSPGMYVIRRQIAELARM